MMTSIASETKRNSSVELMRLILICMVLILHTNKDILFKYSYAGTTANIYYLRMWECLAAVSTNCFILITGYYSVHSTKLKVRKIFDLFFLTCFYGGLIYLVGCLGFHIEQFKFKDFVKCSIPFFFDKCWFINYYLILNLFIPFINKGIKLLTKHSYKVLLLVSVVLFSVWPSFLPNPPSKDNGYGVISFFMLYIIGAYFGLYGDKGRTKIHYLVGYFGFSIITFALFFRSEWTWRWINYNSIFIVLASLFFFLFFTKISSFYNRGINRISHSVIAVFLIHTNQVIRPNIFVKWFSIQNYLFTNTIIFVLLHMAMVISILLICIVIDLGRSSLFYITFNRVFDGIKPINQEIEI